MHIPTIMYVICTCTYLLYYVRNMYMHIPTIMYVICTCTPILLCTYKYILYCTYSSQTNYCSARKMKELVKINKVHNIGNLHAYYMRSLALFGNLYIYILRTVPVCFTSPFKPSEMSKKVV
jgi:hypothetical protein